MKKSILNLPLWAHAIGAAAAVAGFQFAKGALDKSYAASNHPVDYATGQTSFSGETIKDYYATMQNAGTLDVYWMTQIIDFGFIFTIALMSIFLVTLVARASRAGSWGRRIGMLASVAILSGAISDAIENGWSFIMLANPESFANWIALPYSAFASLKFALIALGMLLMLTSLLCALAGRIFKKPRIG